MGSQTKHIEKLATLALAKSGAQTLPVLIEEIATAFKLEVVEFPFHSKISGLLKKEEGIIAVNITHHPVRRRFTIAHELGHFLLGHGLGEEYQEQMVDDFFDKPHDQEREANLFASHVLMPTQAVKTEVAKDGLDLEKLAKTFEVSKQAITIRLLELKLI